MFQTFHIGVNSLSPTILQRDAAGGDPRKIFAGTIDKGKASGRLVPILYKLNIC